MSRSITDQQWAAARAISEGQAATHERLAGIMGVHTTTVSHRAAEDKWASIDFRHARLRRMQAQIVETSRRIRAGEELDRVDPEEVLDGDGLAPEADELEPWPDESPSERIARIGAVLTRRTEAILRKVEAGQPLEMRQVTALSSLVALSERIAVMAREEVREQEKKSDEELAEIYRQIENRIAELALEEARRLAIDVLGVPREEVDAKLPWRFDTPEAEFWAEMDDESPEGGPCQADTSDEDCAQ
jgi:hypothetical protein